MSSQDQPPNQPPSSLTNPQDDAERIRLKRLAKLAGPGASSPNRSESSTPVPQSSPAPPLVAKAKPIPAPTPRSAAPAAYTPRPTHRPSAPPKFNFPLWEHETIQNVLKVTLKAEHAGSDLNGLIWLRDMAEEVKTEDPSLRLTNDLLDRLVIARLEYDPQASIFGVNPSAIPTSFEYLTGCWKRLQTTKTQLHRRGYAVEDVAQAMPVLTKLKELLVSYAGLSLQEPSMFYQPPGKAAGSRELVQPLLGLASSSPLTSLSHTPSSAELLEPSDVEPFLVDLATRFDGDGLDDIMSGVFKDLVDLIRQDRQGLAGTGTENGWRAALAAIEGLVAIKPVASVMTQLDTWNPRGISAAFIEHLSLIGPAARLGVFTREWPHIGQLYFSEPDKKTQADIDSANTNLRATLHVLQQSLFSIFNASVRAGTQPREAILNYFATALNLNLKRGGMQVDPATVASDGYMVNLQNVLLRLAEPFLDAKFSKIDKVDSLYFVHSERLNVSEETRIKATSEEVNTWVKDIKEQLGMSPSPNFISEIFFLTAAFNHYGFVRTLSAHSNLERSIGDIQDHIDRLESDTSYIGTPMERQVAQALAHVKTQKIKRQMDIFAYQVQLLDSDFIFRMVGFTTFLMAWLIRLVDPAKRYPEQPVSLPLPKEPPKAFVTLPEYFIEDIVEFYFFIVRYSPNSIELSGKKEVVEFVMTFLTSTWYIKNPHLKARLVQIIFYGSLAYGRDKQGVLGPVLQSHPMALKHLVPALMSFYVEVEHTGASSQFYDKFDSRRNIAYIMKAIWNNPDHRNALNKEVEDNMDNFIRFANLLMNDCTYLLDESLSKLSEIHTIQLEMASEAWASKTADEKKDRMKALQTAEHQATSYTTLGKSTVGLLKDFTAQTKTPFMVAEIVDRLAAMLNYNLDALAGPKCSNLAVKNMDKYRFRPRELLSDMLSIYLNLSDQPEFMRAVASEGRSYKKSTFERAAGIATKRGLKSSTEVEQLMLFVTKVEETRMMVEAEEDLGDIPDEFLDPLMYTLMRDPVKLPSSRTTIDRSTIKAHLLSDPTDPFNRAPLVIEDVIPDIDLKERIVKWIASKKGNGMTLEEPEVSISMDTDLPDDAMES